MVSIRVEEELLRQVDEAVKAEKRDRSAIVREALILWQKRRTLAKAVQRDVEGYVRHPVSKDEFGPVLRGQRWPK
jgi:metal-responsive CopG/Arc/MetJ family transcriptional regulator